MINTVSFHCFFQKLYENVLQNVLTDWMSRKSRNFSQISPRRYISNYFSIQSMGDVEILQVATSIKISPHKENPPPPPHMEKMASKRRKEALHLEKKHP